MSEAIFGAVFNIVENVYMKQHSCQLVKFFYAITRSS